MSNDKKYWFKRRRFGYGWIPASKEGWLVLAGYLVLIFGGALTLQDVPDGEFTKEVGFYLLFVAVATIVLVQISMRYGPKPKWRWGKKSDYDPDEDW